MPVPNRYAALFLLLLPLLGCNNSWVHTIKQVEAAEQEPTIQSGETGQHIRLAAGKHYRRSGVHSYLWGENYRQEWATPLEVPVLNLQAEGYEIIREGGGRQTRNLRLRDENKHQYVLRSVDKDPAVNVPKFYHFFGIGKLVKDQTSSANPYAPLTVPPMADALGVYHTDPQLFYLPYQADMGEYSETFAGMMVILEHRPDGDRSDFVHLGASKNIRSSYNLKTEVSISAALQSQLPHFQALALRH